MTERWNAMQWDGEPGHYEVWYVTFTDPATGVGFWIRYTMVAPLPGTGEQATCSLWLMAMDPADPSRNVGQKVSFPVSQMHATAEPFELRIGDATLTDRGMTGSLRAGRHRQRVGPVLGAAPARPTVTCTRSCGGRRSPRRCCSCRTRASGCAGSCRSASGASTWRERKGGRRTCGAPSTRHAGRGRTATTSPAPDGAARDDTFIDGVSVYVPRFGREIGPNTPVVARIGGRDLLSVGPLAVTRNPSEFGLDHWRFEARDGRRKATCEVSARREDLVGVTYHDPDGELAYCYNTEVADMRLNLWERDGRRAPMAQGGRAALRAPRPLRVRTATRRSTACRCS